jgi:Ankyrin repeats (3 copies)/Ankyrin repeats (many copies)
MGATPSVSRPPSVHGSGFASASGFEEDVQSGQYSDLSDHASSELVEDRLKIPEPDRSRSSTPPSGCRSNTPPPGDSNGNLKALDPGGSTPPRTSSSSGSFIRKSSLQVYREQSNRVSMPRLKRTSSGVPSVRTSSSRTNGSHDSSSMHSRRPSMENAPGDEAGDSATEYKLKFEYNGVPSLLHAAKENHLPTVMYIMEKFEKGYQIEAKDKDGWTPLLFAISNGNVPMAALLVAKGANVKAREVREDLTALHMAVSTGVLPGVMLLIHKGADLSAVDKKDRTPLHLAATMGHLAIAEYLVSRGANLEVKNKQHETPLFSAVINGHLPVVDFLISKGANIAVRLDVSVASPASRVFRFLW